jgi:hypothetical protein
MAKHTQLDKFRQAARDLETDNSEKRFNERLRKLARQKPTSKRKKVAKKLGCTLESPVEQNRL